MGWRDHLQDTTKLDLRVLPWAGGRTLAIGERSWTIHGDLPPEHMWAVFDLRTNGKAYYQCPKGDNMDFKGKLDHVVKGYLVGDRIVPDESRSSPSPEEIGLLAETVFLLDPGLPRFARVAAGRLAEGTQLIFKGQEFPLGPEDDVLQAFYEGRDIDDVKYVTPALEAAFKMEVYQREQARKRREEAERRRREEEERIRKEEERRKLVNKLGDGAGRREMAKVDFEAAARAALTVGGAELLDHRPGPVKGEHVVTFRHLRRRFECVCDGQLRIVDAGICLRAETARDGFRAGTVGDTFFSLESLPSVIKEAETLGRLVVFRHVGDDDVGDDDDDY